MVIQIGGMVEGVVVKIAEYGAFVRLVEGSIGLIHISEIADAFVNDVRHYLKENDKVDVKVLKRNADGRYELSLRQADKAVSHKTSRERPLSSSRTNNRIDQKASAAPIDFEGRMTQFLKDSEERQLELKRHLESKRGVRRR